MCLGSTNWEPERRCVNLAYPDAFLDVSFLSLQSMPLTLKILGFIKIFYFLIQTLYLLNQNEDSLTRFLYSVGILTGCSSCLQLFTTILTQENCKILRAGVVISTLSQISILPFVISILIFRLILDTSHFLCSRLISALYSHF